ELAYGKSIYAPIWLLAFINGVGPRVGESGFGLTAGFAYTAPYEDITLRRPARRKISVLLLVLVTEIFFRPRAICSTCSNRRMWCRPGGTGHRSFCGPKTFTALARQRAATKPRSSKPVERHCARPNESGSPPTAIARVSS